MSQTVVIVGGGSAGWLTAGILAAKLKPLANIGEGTRIILLESPDVAILGVGEGTWPTMRDTLRQMGISEVEFLRCCDASFKQGSQFIDWHRGEGESYYHPFSVPNAYTSINLAAHWQASHQDLSFVDAVCAQGRVCDLGLAPKSPQTPEYAFSVNYGYHLNAGKFVQLLQRHCTEQLDVVHQLGHVQQVISAENGDIAELHLSSGESVKGDLFIDCTGFAARLIGEHYQIPFIARHEFLFNDTALALQANYSSEDAPIASCTKATAKACGWIWDIALPSRRGIGFTFSSQHTTLEKAEDELARYIQADPDLAKSQSSPRKIQFQPGHRETFWHKNCVAIGVSAGFVEPLEASALVLIEKSAEWIAQQLPQDRAAMTVLAKRFNEMTRQRWDAVIDFLKLHYVLTQRRDSDYWRDHCRVESMPASLQDSLSLWRTQVPWHHESNVRSELFSAASVQYILYGMKFSTDIKDSRYRAWQKETEIAQRLIRDNLAKTEALIVSLPKNRDLMNKVNKK
jgi:tryptophan 7-halogenase